MNKQIKIIRDLPLVEKELNSALAGVIAISLKKEGFIQFATNFVYLNKNIFFYIENEEVLRTIKLDTLSKFTILSEKNVTKEFLEKKEPLYHLFSVVVTGEIKEAEEKKTISTVAQSFIEKGFGKVYALKGGWREWFRSKYPYEEKS